MKVDVFTQMSSLVSRFWFGDGHVESSGVTTWFTPLGCKSDFEQDMMSQIWKSVNEKLHILIYEYGYENKDIGHRFYEYE